MSTPNATGLVPQEELGIIRTGEIAVCGQSVAKGGCVASEKAGRQITCNGGRTSNRWIVIKWTKTAVGYVPEACMMPAG